MTLLATAFKICAVERKLKIARYEKRRFTFWLISAKWDCLGSISNPRRLLIDVETVPGRYNWSGNPMIDKKMYVFFKVRTVHFNFNTACRDYDAKKLGFWTIESPKNAWNAYFLSFTIAKCSMMFKRYWKIGWTTVWKQLLHVCRYTRRLVIETLDLLLRCFESIFGTGLNNSPCKALTMIRSLNKFSKILNQNVFIAKNFLDIVRSLQWVSTL